MIPSSTKIRFLNFIIDSVFIFFLSNIVTTSIQVSLDEDYYSQALQTLPIVIPICVAFIYYFLFELAFGRTIGKIITGTHVVPVTGKIDTATIFIRTLVRFIPFFDVLSFLHTKKPGYHDAWSGTTVVKKAKKKVEVEGILKTNDGEGRIKYPEITRAFKSKLKRGSIILGLVLMLLNPSLNRYKEYIGIIEGVSLNDLNDDNYIGRKYNFIIFSIYGFEDRQHIGILWNFFEV